jgi:hypothetical protein
VPLRSLVLLVLFAAMVAASAPASAESFDSAGARLTPLWRHGVGVLLPSDWHVVGRKLTPCIDPSEQLTVAGRGALVMLQERLHAVAGEFPARPSRFELSGSPEYLECCAPLARRGWVLRFEDNGRGFYAYVYLGASGTRAQALAILDSLRIADALETA